MLRRMISVVLIVCLLGGMPVAVNAQTNPTEEVIRIAYSFPKLYDSDVDCKDSIAQLENQTDLQQLEAVLLQGIQNVDEMIDLSAFSLPSASFSYITDYIWYRMPLAFHVGSLAGLINPATDKIVSLTLVYRSFADTKDEYDACLTAFENAAGKILNNIEGNTKLSDVEKALLLHDRLALWNEYDYGSSGDIKHTAYGALGLRKSVCQGYAMAYMYLLDRIGIDNYYCASDALKHGWNIVTIDGKDYHVDVTWDDPSWERGSRGRVGYVQHDNFLRSTQGFVATGHNATDYDNTPTDTTYDSYYWQNSNTAFQLLDDALYYIDHDKQAIKAAGSPQVIYSVEDAWSAGDGYVWRGNYSCLSSDGEDLLFSLSDGVYKLNVGTSVAQKIFAPTLQNAQSVFGFAYEIGELICDINTTPNEAANLAQVRQAYGEIPVQSISIKNLPSRVQYVCGEALNTAGLVLNVVYANGTSTTVDSGFTVSGFDSSEPGTVTVYVDYKGCRTAFEVTVVCAHSNTENRAGVAATCSAVGYTAGVYCNDCETYVSGHAVIAIDPDAHVWDDGKLVTEATCSKIGEKTYVCRYNAMHTKRETIGLNSRNHKSTENVTAVAATCTTAGYTEGVYCNDCETYISGHAVIAINPKAHEWNSGEIAVTADCNTEGVKTYTCAHNANHKKTENIGLNANNHTNTKQVAGLAATCTTAGYTEGVYCNDCETYISGHGVIPAINHRNKYSIARTEPTCTSVGFTAGEYCPDCETYVSGHAVIAINPKAHEWNSGKITVTADCNTEGVKTYTCAHNANHKKTENLGLNANNHTNTKQVAELAATCTTAGYTEGVYCNDCETYISGHGVIPAINHRNKYSIARTEPTCTSVGFTAGEYCPDCETYVSGHTEIAINPKAHEWNSGKITVTADCNTEGVKTYTCAHNANHKKTENLGLNANNHTDTKQVAELSATCTTAGYTEGVYCNDCETYISGHGVIPAINHRNKYGIARTEPTCTSVGFTAGEYCPDCETYVSGHAVIAINPDAHAWNSGEITVTADCNTEGVKTYICTNNENHKKTETIELNANNHTDTKQVAELAATCTTAGYTAGVYCNDCETYISGHGVIPAINHRNKYGIARTEPTCTSVGFTAGEYCPDCETYVSGHTEIAIDPDAHEWNSGEITVTADCNTEGVKTYTCAHNANHKKTETIGLNANNHTNTRAMEAVAPTTSSVGYTAGVYCNDCKTYISGHEEIPMLPQISFADSENAKKDGDSVRISAGITSTQLLSQTSVGAYILKANGTKLTSSEKPATGMILVLSQSEQYELVMPGDADGDAEISVADARLALRASVGLENYSEDSAQYKACNVNGATMAPADAREILRVAVGLGTAQQWMQ